MKNVSEILKWIREVDYSTLPYNVSGIGWGPKRSKGKETNEHSLIFYVSEKKSLSELNLSEIIPSHFAINKETDTVTDVQAQAIYEPLTNSTYSIVPSVTSLDESINRNLTCYINTTNVPNNTFLYWSVSATSGVVTGSDFDSGASTGWFTVINNETFVDMAVRTDSTTEGKESFIVELRLPNSQSEAKTVTNALSATVVAATSIIAIEDTSTQKPDCHVGPSDYNPPHPITLNRQKHRPLKGGISSIFLDGSDATLGLFVRDKSDGSVVALSNNHVYAAGYTNASFGRWIEPTQILGHYKKENFQHAYSKLSNLIALSSIQPANTNTNPYGTSSEDPNTRNKDFIGVCSRAVPIGNESPKEFWLRNTGGFGPVFTIDKTSCDAAIVQLSSYDLISEDSVNILHFEQPGPYPFATDEEIDSLLDPSSPNFGSPIFRSGRTCGPIGYPGYTDSCSLSAYQFGSSLVGGFNGGSRSNFTNCFFIRGNIVPGRGGDSGSCMLALLSSNVPSVSAWKVIGLLFAGPGGSFPEFTIGCRITSIVRDLGIVSWDGKMPTLSSSSTLEELSNVYSPYVELSGRKYYQMGFKPYYI